MAANLAANYEAALREEGGWPHLLMQCLVDQARVSLGGEPSVRPASPFCCACVLCPAQYLVSQGCGSSKQELQVSCRKC